MKTNYNEKKHELSIKDMFDGVGTRVSRHFCLDGG